MDSKTQAGWQFLQRTSDPKKILSVHNKRMKNVRAIATDNHHHNSNDRNGDGDNCRINEYPTS